MFVILYMHMFLLSHNLQVTQILGNIDTCVDSIKDYIIKIGIIVLCNTR